jgi:hypothetical protein
MLWPTSVSNNTISVTAAAAVAAAAQQFSNPAEHQGA